MFCCSSISFPPLGCYSCEDATLAQESDTGRLGSLVFARCERQDLQKGEVCDGVILLQLDESTASRLVTCVLTVCRSEFSSLPKSSVLAVLVTPFALHS